MPQMTLNGLMSLVPIFMLVGLAALSLVQEIFFGEQGRIANGLVMALGTLATLAIVSGSLMVPDPVAAEPFIGSLLFDHFTLYFSAVVLIAASFAILLTLSDPEVRCGEVYALILLATTGMIVMASALDLMTVLLGLEIMSLSIYALVGIRRTDLLSNEAALKYFLLGAFASALFVYGMVLCYGASGSVYFDQIAQAGTKPLLLVGMGLILAGFAFKVALVPFHMWTPDVYEGAPTAVTTFMATGVKAAGFAAFFRVFLTAFPDLYFQWQPMLMVLAILTMTVGNLAALAQTSIKRMLSYSSISHAGYILVAFAACDPTHQQQGVAAGLFYLLTYVFMSAGAFTVVMLMDLSTEGDDRQRYRGIGWTRPWTGFVLSVCLLSLAGIPPMGGFIAKFYVFSAALDAGLFWLVIAAVVNSLISLYYYLRPLVWMYMDTEGEEDSTWRSAHNTPLWVHLVLLATLLGTLAMGFFPGPRAQQANFAAKAITPVYDAAQVKR